LQTYCFEKIKEGKYYQVTNRTKLSEIKFTKISEYKNAIKELEMTSRIEKKNQEVKSYQRPRRHRYFKQLTKFKRKKEKFKTEQDRTGQNRTGQIKELKFRGKSNRSQVQ